MYKLGGKNLFSLWILVKKKSDVYSADRCNFSESDTDCSRNGTNLYKSWFKGALNSGPFCHFRFANHHFNWQILVKVWTDVIGLSCLMRTILEYEKVRQIWTLLKDGLFHILELFSSSKINLQQRFKFWSRSASCSDDLQIWNGQMV